MNEPIEIELSSDDNEERKSQFENDEPKEIIKELIEKEQNHNSSKIPVNTAIFEYFRIQIYLSSCEKC